MTVTKKDVMDAAELGAGRAIVSYNKIHQEQHRDEKRDLRWFVTLSVTVGFALIAYFSKGG